jgi:hypothetical protein
VFDPVINLPTFPHALLDPVTLDDPSKYNEPVSISYMWFNMIEPDDGSGVIVLVGNFLQFSAVRLI